LYKTPDVPEDFSTYVQRFQACVCLRKRLPLRTLGCGMTIYILVRAALNDCAKATPFRKLGTT